MVVFLGTLPGHLYMDLTCSVWDTVDLPKTRICHAKNKLSLPNFRLAKSKSIALPSPTKVRKEFGKLKRIRSGEILTGSPERDLETELSLDRSFERGDDVIDHHDDNDGGANVTLRHSGDIRNADYEESPHFPRDKSKINVSPTKTQSGSGSINHSASVKVGPTVMEPNVDFDFHVKISVNSGKCVLHTAKDEEKRRMKKDRSFSGNIFDNSPNVSRKFRSGGGPPGTGDNRERSSTRLRAPTAQDMTIFYIPGHYFDVKDIVKQ